VKIFIRLIIILLPFFTYSQYTGATPWKDCYGINAECKLYVKDGYYVGCSNIEVNSSPNSPVVVIIKRDKKVLKHAYISANSSHSIEVPDGTYQVFFYYGKKWDKNKKMISDKCPSLYGGFISDEYVGKDNPITLESQIMTYTLTEVTYGNFSQKSSSLSEAL
tara:strand:- start:181 stop:669 length:489 start_codon:yes stop_codon:yes gene_type:complete